MLFGIVLIVSIVTIPREARAGETLITRHSLEVIVRITATGLGGLMESVENPQEHIELIRRFIQPIRFFPDKSGYFFVYDINGVCVAHATQPELVGKNLHDLQDAKGKYVIKDFISVARKGGGAVEYWWRKPNSDVVHDTISYVIPIPNTNLFIGSGIYYSSLR